MTKIKIFLLLTIIGFALFVPALETKAVETEPKIAWASLPLYSTYMAIEGTITLPEGVLKVDFYIPDSDYHILGIGGIDSYLVIYNGVTEIFNEDITYFHGADLVGWYSLDLAQLGVLGATEIVIVITQTYSVLPSGYVGDDAYLDTYDSLSFVYNAPYDIELSFINLNLYSTYYALKTTIEVPYDTRSLSLYLAPTQFFENSFGGVDSEIVFYDIDDVELFSLTYEDLNSINGFVRANLIPYFTTYEVDVGETAYITIIAVMNYSQLPSQLIQYMNDNSSITFNDNLKLAIFVNDGLEENYELFYNIPTFYTPTKTGYSFIGWALANGAYYDFITPIEAELLFNDNLYLYARYSIITSGDPTPADQTPNSVIDSVLATVGFNNDFGHIIIYLIVLVITILIMVKIQLSVMIMAVAAIVITALFIYLGILPFLVSIFAIGLSSTVLLFNIKGSD